MSASHKKKGSFFTSLFALVFLITMLAPVTLLLGGGTALAAYPPAEETRIRELIYPTLGDPAIVKQGETLEIEWDFRNGDPSASLPTTVTGWSATLSTAATAVPVARDLTLVPGSVVLEPSSRWDVYYTGPDYGLDGPEAPGYGGLGYDVYKATFSVPADAPVELFDLTVSVNADGDEVERTTDNSVKVVAEYKDDYWFGVMSDVHTNDARGGISTYAGNPEVTEHRSFLKGLDFFNHLDLEYVLVAGDTVMGVPNKDYSVYIPKVTPKSEVDVYTYEYNLAYNQLTASEHPLVMGVGNHDTYVTDDGDNDGLRYWQDFFGPEYFGWDYGDKAHVSVLNSDDHPYDSSTGGRVSFLRNAAFIDTSIYIPTLWYLGKFRETQRSWMTSEIASGASSPFSAVLQHHAPAGEHKAWQDGFWSGLQPGLFPGWPEGEKGRTEELALLNEYQVDACITGHEHADSVDYDVANAHTLQLNNTTTSFDCTTYPAYPGIRLVHVSGDNVDSYCYYPDAANNNRWSVPIYAEASFPVPEGPATPEYLSTFTTPLMESYIIENSLQQFPLWAGYDWTRGVTDITQRVINHFDPASPQAVVLENGRMTFNMPRPGPGTEYVVDGIYKSVTWEDTEVGGRKYRVFNVVVDLPAGATTDVRVHLDPPTPYVQSISAAAAPIGAEVTLTGANFGSAQPASYVSFGGVQADTYGSWTDDAISVTVPDGVTGDVKVTVTTPDGTSNGVDFAPLAISGVSPAEAIQGTLTLPVEVTGSGFLAGATVKLVGASSTISPSQVKVDSSSQITATFGFGGAAPGTYDVVVTNADGQSVTLAGSFEVTPMCGAGGGAGMIVLGLSFGLLGAAGIFRRRFRQRVER